MVSLLLQSIQSKVDATINIHEHVSYVKTKNWVAFMTARDKFDTLRWTGWIEVQFDTKLDLQNKPVHIHCNQMTRPQQPGIEMVSSTII
jgi:hypothetical protein